VIPTNALLETSSMGKDEVEAAKGAGIEVSTEEPSNSAYINGKRRWCATSRISNNFCRIAATIIEATAELSGEGGQVCNSLDNAEPLGRVRPLHDAGKINGQHQRGSATALLGEPKRFQV
jgi:hypothetical protein